MDQKEKIKFYTHHDKFVPVKLKPQSAGVKFRNSIAARIFRFFYRTGKLVLKFLSATAHSIIFACYHIGRLLLSFPLKIYKLVKNEVINTEKSFAKRLKLLLRLQYAKTLLIFFIIAGLSWAAFGSLNLIARGLEIKNKIMRTAFLGQNYLSQAKDAVSAQDFSRAENRFSLAYQAFERGQNQIQESDRTLNQLLSLIPQKRDADKLLQAASLIAQAGQDSISLQKNLDSLKLSAVGISSSPAPTAEVFDQLEAGLNQIVDKISKANDLVSQVDSNNLPKANRQTFTDLKDQLYLANFTLNNFKEIFSLCKNLLMGDKNVLILLENNNELRPTGGFIGTYGNLKVHNGSISKIQVSSIYDLDGQLKDTIQPPLPLLNVNDRWFMRDANWFADFPDSAKKLSHFYEMEGGETPDVIIALTPNIIIDWLKITGPIALPHYGVTITADNFIEQIQAITTLTDGLPTNSPKQVLADMFPLLLDKISQADSQAWTQIIQSLQDNLNNKQIVFYAKDQDTQNLLTNFHWSGNLQSTDRDFLSVISSNLGGTKTDLQIEQTIKLTSSISVDGTITNDLEITRTNKMPDLPQTENVNFLRVYAPLGSKLISNLGFDYKIMDYPQGKKYKIDDDVFQWEKNLLKDVVSGTVMGTESGKTFFGNWIELKGGETRTVKLSYQLPFKLNNIDRYSLLLQKQIGAINDNFTWQLNFQGRQIAWKNFDPKVLDTQSLNSDIILSKDYFFGMVLSPR